MNLKNIHNIYFIGIGGIGMSALARYFNRMGKNIAGYDRTLTALTRKLESEGMHIHYQDEPDKIPVAYKEKNSTLVVFTPAIPDTHHELSHFRKLGFTVMKRAALLGKITASNKGIAVAGTHGKTSVSAIIAYILMNADIHVSAFLGGIAVNYNTNFLTSRLNQPKGNGDANASFSAGFKDKEPGKYNTGHMGDLSGNSYIVMEADEYDRSFLQLHPYVGVVTSMDPDHLDIYGSHDELKKAFGQFAGQISTGGTLVHKAGLDENFRSIKGIEKYTYAFEEKADYRSENVRIDDGSYVFDLVAPGQKITGIRMSYPGKMNVENATGAIAACMSLGIKDPMIFRKALKNFMGVKRRFELVIKSDKLIFIDDYAHHPRELEACISSVRALYPDRRITGIFQPHLYSRTRDFAGGFAESLSLLDELVMLDIYPAREEPMEGVSSKMILDKVDLKNKSLVAKNELVTEIKNKKPELLLTLGAGDIDQLVEPLKNELQEL